ncbi:hypothetical protein SAMN02745163_01486 [Clostridium cavendishii DSM 21758]|uniref:Uncharacterized protein n=1 Tax=Clostridium cavendishii DSM 21758 TaxID=1121302 RepID=A0A1M6HI08_9CLOT|nr:hypothetical protein [Clostridium cavendishii]SHJ21847.1 hypothetical protein SAMN02745163_01486 [Clostridium cavendishii DSM 21758]
MKTPIQAKPILRNKLGNSYSESAIAPNGSNPLCSLGCAFLSGQDKIDCVNTCSSIVNPITDIIPSILPFIL